MGAWYEVRFSGDENAYVLVYQDNSTDWQEKRQAITQEQLEAYDKLSQQHAEEMRELLKSFIKEAE